MPIPRVWALDPFPITDHEGTPCFEFSKDLALFPERCSEEAGAFFLTLTGMKS